MLKFISRLSTDKLLIKIAYQFQFFLVITIDILKIYGDKVDSKKNK